MARPLNAQRPLHPFSPFNPVCTYGDIDINICQDQIYYMTGRLQAILLQRIDGPHTEQQWQWWNVRFGAEVELASALIGWAAVVGTNLDIPYLLRTICSFLPFIHSAWKLTYTPDMKQLLHTPPAEPSSRATTFLRPRQKYLNEWWKSGSGEDTPLNMELLQVAYSPPQTIDAIPLTVTPSRVPDVISEVTTALPGPKHCTHCTASRAIARRAVVALRECAAHMAASRQFAEWSAGQSQRVIKACRQLCLEHRKIGRKIGLEDLVRLGATDTREMSGDPDHNQATTYPSADGINWDLFPYEDTQGPLLSSVISQDPPPPPSPMIHSTSNIIGQDGFNIERWAAAVPEILTTPVINLNRSPSYVLDNPGSPIDIPPVRFVNTSVQVPSSSGFPITHQAPPDTTGDPRPPSTDIIMGDHIQTRSGTDISSSGLSAKSSGTGESSSSESDGSDMDMSSDMGEAESENEDAIAAAYMGD